MEACKLQLSMLDLSNNSLSGLPPDIGRLYLFLVGCIRGLLTVFYINLSIVVYLGVAMLFDFVSFYSGSHYHFCSVLFFLYR